MDSIKIVNKIEYDDVFIIFSSRNMKKGDFTLYSQLININFPANMIFINDYSNNYYLGGTPEFKTELDFINFLLKKIYILKRNFGKLFIFGASMGGYAALKYGSILQADKILAFGVEYKLGLPFGHSYETISQKNNLEDSKITNLVYKNPKKIYIISGNDDISDLYSAIKFKNDNPNINVFLINNYGHVVARYIQQKVGLTKFIFNFFTKKEEIILFDIFSIIIPPDMKYIKTIKKFFNFIEGNHCSSIKNDILELSRKYPNWSRVQFYMSYCLYKNNDILEAKKYIEYAIANISDNLYRVRLKLALLYFKKGTIKEGVEESQILLNTGLSLDISMLLIKLYEIENEKY